MADNIVVALRVRKLIPREVNDPNCLKYWQAKENFMIQIDPETKKQVNIFGFDEVFDEAVSNSELFESVAHPIVQAGLSGINGTIFAYGQTSSGKTFTMSGTDSVPGIIPLSIQNIFSSIENTPDREYLLRASYMEIYQENIFDLLTGAKINTIREDVTGQVCVSGLKEVCVTSEEMLLTVMANGDKRRKVGETNMNERSSRSHSIFRLIIESRERNDKDCEGAVTVSHLNLVDLAGSENASQTGAVGDRLKEGGSINKSLFMLGRVISQLSDREQFVNYRDSKLTRILQNSLGGNAKTAIVCTVTPASREQTLSTVRFASRAKSIQNKPIVNEVLSESALLKRYAMEIKKLKEALENERNVDRAQEMEQVKEKLDEQEKQNYELQEKLKSLKEKLVVSSITLDTKKSKDKKLRRETWAAPAHRRALRLSMALGSIGPPLVVPSPFNTFKGNSTPLSNISEEGTISSNVSSVANDSCISFEGNDAAEDLFQQNEVSKLKAFDDNFLSPQMIPKRRRRNRDVIFTPSVLSSDVGCQTDESSLCPPVLRLQSESSMFLTPTRYLMSPMKGLSPFPVSPSGGTPKEVLRSVNRKLKDLLESKGVVLQEWREELKELEEFHRNELKVLSETYEERMGSSFLTKEDLEDELKEMKKSLKDAEQLYLDANKTVWDQSDELKKLRAKVVELEEDRTVNSAAVQERDQLKEEVQSLTKELKEKRNRIEMLERNQADFDLQMELASGKRKENEQYLRRSLNEAWDEIANFKRLASCTPVTEPNSKEEIMEKELRELTSQIELEKDAKDQLNNVIATLRLQLQTTEEELQKEKETNNRLKEDLAVMLSEDQDNVFKRPRPISPTKRRYSILSNFDSTMYTCEDRSPLERSNFFNLSSNSNVGEVSRKLSETLQILDDSLLGGVKHSAEGNVGSSELQVIREQLVQLQDMLLVQGNNFLVQDIMDEDIIANPSLKHRYYLDTEYVYWKEVETAQLLESISSDFIWYSSPENLFNHLGTIKIEEMTSFNEVEEVEYPSDEPSHSELSNQSETTNEVFSLADELKMANLNATDGKDITINETLNTECEVRNDVQKQTELIAQVEDFKRKENSYLQQIENLELQVVKLEKELSAKLESKISTVTSQMTMTENASEIHQQSQTHLTCNPVSDISPEELISLHCQKNAFEKELASLKLEILDKQKELQEFEEQKKALAFTKFTLNLNQKDDEEYLSCQSLEGMDTSFNSLSSKISFPKDTEETVGIVSKEFADMNEEAALQNVLTAEPLPELILQKYPFKDQSVCLMDEDKNLLKKENVKVEDIQNVSAELENDQDKNLNAILVPNSDATDLDITRKETQDSRILVNESQDVETPLKYNPKLEISLENFPLFETSKKGCFDLTLTENSESDGTEFTPELSLKEMNVEATPAQDIALETVGNLEATLDKSMEARPESKALVDEVTFLLEKVKCQESLINSLRIELNDLRSREEELDSMIVEFTLKEEELEEKEGRINAMLEEKSLMIDDLESKISLLTEQLNASKNQRSSDVNTECEQPQIESDLERRKSEPMANVSTQTDFVFPSSINVGNETEGSPVVISTVCNVEAQKDVHIESLDENKEQTISKKMVGTISTKTVYLPTESLDKECPISSSPNALNEYEKTIIDSVEKSMSLALEDTFIPSHERSSDMSLPEKIQLESNLTTGVLEDESVENELSVDSLEKTYRNPVTGKMESSCSFSERRDEENEFVSNNSSTVEGEKVFESSPSCLAKQSENEILHASIETSKDLGEKHKSEERIPHSDEISIGCKLNTDQINSLIKEKESLASKLLLLQDESSSLEVERNVLKEEKASLIEQVQVMGTEIDLLRTKFDQLSDCTASQEKDQETASSVCDALKSETEPSLDIQETSPQLGIEIALPEGELDSIQKKILHRGDESESPQKEILQREKELESQQKEIVQWEKELESRQKEIFQQEKELEACKKEILLGKSDLDSYQKEILHKENELESCKKEILLHKNELDSCQKEIRLKENELESCKKEILLNKSELDSCQKEIRLKENELESCKKEILLHKNELDSYQKEILHKENELESCRKEILLYKSELDSCQKEIRLKENELESCRKEILLHKNELDSYQKEILQKENDLETFRKEILQWESDLDSCRKEVRQRENEVESCKNQILERETELESCQKESLQRKNEVEFCQKEILTSQANVTRLEEIVDQLKVELSQSDKHEEILFLQSKVEELNSKCLEKSTKVDILNSQFESQEKEINNYKEQFECFSKNIKCLENEKVALSQKVDEIDRVLSQFDLRCVQDIVIALETHAATIHNLESSKKEYEEENQKRSDVESRMKKEIEELKSEISILEELGSKHIKEIEEHEKDRQSMFESITNLKSECEHYCQKIVALERESEAKSMDKGLQRELELMDNIASLKTSSQEKEKEIGSLKVAIENLDLLLAKSKREYEEYKTTSENEILSINQSLENKTEELDIANREILEKQRHIVSLESFLESKNAICHTKETKITELVEMGDIQAKEIESLSERNADLETRIKSNEEKKSKMEMIHENLISEKQKLIEKLKLQETEAATLTKECDALKIDIDLIYNDKESAVKSLNEALANLQDISNLLEVKEVTIQDLECELEEAKRVHGGCAEREEKYVTEAENLVNLVEKYEAEVSEKEAKCAALMVEKEAEKQKKLDIESNMKEIILQKENVIKEITQNLTQEKMLVQKGLDGLQGNFNEIKSKLMSLEEENSNLKCAKRGTMIEEKERELLESRKNEDKLKETILEKELLIKEIAQDLLDERRLTKKELSSLQTNLKETKEKLLALEEENSRFKLLIENGERKRNAESQTEEYSPRKMNEILELKEENDKLVRALQKTKEELLKITDQYKLLKGDFDDSMKYYEDRISSFEDLNKEYGSKIKVLQKQNLILSETIHSQTQVESKSMSIDETLCRPHLNHGLLKCPVPCSKTAEIPSGALSEKIINDLKEENTKQRNEIEKLTEEKVDLMRELEDIKVQLNTLKNTSITTPSSTSMLNVSTRQSKRNLLDKIDKLQFKVFELEQENENLRGRDGIIGSNEELDKQLNFMKKKLQESESMNQILNKNYDLLEKDVMDLTEKNNVLENKLKAAQEMQIAGSNLKTETLKKDRHEKEIQTDDESDKTLREEYFELKRQNNILNLKLKGLYVPAEREVQKLKEELKMEHAKNKKLLSDLRRLQNANINEQSILELNPGAPAHETEKDKEMFSSNVGFASKIVLDVQMMGLQNLNYHLEKEKEKLKRENETLKDHVKHYKSKAQEWKLKYYEDSGLDSEQKVKKGREASMGSARPKIVAPSKEPKSEVKESLPEPKSFSTQTTSVTHSATTSEEKNRTCQPSSMTKPLSPKKYQTAVKDEQNWPLSSSKQSNKSEDRLLSPSKHSNKSEDRLLSPSKHSNKSEEMLLSPIKHSNKSEDRMLSPSKHSNKSEDRMLSPSKHSNKSEGRLLSGNQSAKSEWDSTSKSHRSASGDYLKHKQSEKENKTPSFSPNSDECKMQ